MYRYAVNGAPYVIRKHTACGYIDSLFFYFYLSAVDQSGLTGNDYLRIVGYTGLQLILSTHAASQFDLIVCHLSIFVYIHIAVTGTCLFHNRQIGNNHILFRTEVQTGTANIPGRTF